MLLDKFSFASLTPVIHMRDLGRDVCDMTYSPTQTNMLLTAHGASNVVVSYLIRHC